MAFTIKKALLMLEKFSITTITTCNKTLDILDTLTLFPFWASNHWTSQRVKMAIIMMTILGGL